MLQWDGENGGLIPKAGGKELGHRICTGAGGQMLSGMLLCPFLPEMLTCERGIASTSLPHSSLASVSEHIFQSPDGT